MPTSDSCSQPRAGAVRGIACGGRAEPQDGRSIGKRKDPGVSWHLTSHMGFEHRAARPRHVARVPARVATRLGATAYRATATSSPGVTFISKKKPGDTLISKTKSPGDTRHKNKSAWAGCQPITLTRAHKQTGSRVAEPGQHATTGPARPTSPVRSYVPILFYFLMLLM